MNGLSLSCDRCQGLMCPVLLHDRDSGIGQDNCRALRCLVCGEIIDELILRNRLKALLRRHGPTRSRARHSSILRI
jgi:hypothetical protein